MTDQRISRHLRHRLAVAGVTQMTAAEIAGMKQPALSRTLTGERQWRVDEVVRLARHFGCTVEDLAR